MLKAAAPIVLVAGIAALAWIGYSAQVTFTLEPTPTSIATVDETAATSSLVTVATTTTQTPIPTLTSGTEAATPENPAGLSHDELLALADDKFQDGVVPLGDSKYVTSGPKKGYVYLCNARKDNPGSMVNGPWMHGTTWNYLKKVSVSGSVSWPDAEFSNSVSGSSRIFSGNDLPINHTTGEYPIASSDDAYQYDKNPNSISAQKLSKQLPANPTYSDVPYCMGGEVGIMLSGVALFNAFDAGLRDAPAHELQDSCDGHPQGSSEYHYHSLSACFKDIGVSTVLGYALDGFPITGPKVADKKYLTTEDLDECHGITSEVLIDGKKKMTYHYVMTKDFPYSTSCFRGKPASLMVIQGAAPQGQGGMPRQTSGLQAEQSATLGAPPAGQGGMPPQPPQEAIAACSGMSQGDSCSFSTPDGMQITGHCDTPPGQSALACVPH